MTASKTGWLGDPARHEHIGPAEMVRALYGDTFTSDRRCVLWTKPYDPVWCVTADEVASAAARLDASTDVYIGASLQAASAQRPHARGTAETTVVVPGVWADLDIAGPGKRKTYAPSVEVLLAHLEHRIEQRPSILLLTGGGLHAWWLFDEPRLITCEDTRREAAALVRRWQTRLRDVLAEKGWALDATYDLARVMRLPGTHNHKPEHQPPFLIRTASWEVD